MKMPYFLAVTLLLILAGTGTLRAESDSEAYYLSRFAGDWSGNGHVRKNAETNTWSVSCRVSGQPSANRISINGNCNAALIVNRQIGADLIYDPKSDRYSGIYIGSRIGPAQLSGRRVGNAVRLTITWPKPVNGDTKARMTVQNDGNGNLRITVADNLEPGGPIQTTSEIILSH
jgi:hypothetical protein